MKLSYFHEKKPNELPSSDRNIFRRWDVTCQARSIRQGESTGKQQIRDKTLHVHITVLNSVSLFSPCTVFSSFVCLSLVKVLPFYFISTIYLLYIKSNLHQNMAKFRHAMTAQLMF